MCCYVKVLCEYEYVFQAMLTFAINTKNFKANQLIFTQNEVKKQ